jgi:thiamine-monophosphate kinase
MADRHDERSMSGEDFLIDAYFRPLATHPGALALQDDTAVLAPPPGFDLVLKTDAVIAGVHFFADDPADAIGRKALRVNLSDLAAKGASPGGFLMSLALPGGTGADWLKAFAGGLGADAAHYQCPLLGGDTDRTEGPLTVSIAALGWVPQGTMVRRSGAKPGDQLFVTGTIGDAALGLRLRQDPELAARWGLDGPSCDHLLARYLIPQPRTALAQSLRQHASAAMDISDGLAGDLAKLCRASGVCADVPIRQIPWSEAVEKALHHDPNLVETAVTGGDDYEILCAVPIEQIAAFHAAAAQLSIKVTQIGEVVAGSAAARFLDAAGRAVSFARPSFSHF